MYRPSALILPGSVEAGAVASRGAGFIIGGSQARHAGLQINTRFPSATARRATWTRCNATAYLPPAFFF
jgi:hypothetical protein